MECSNVKRDITTQDTLVALYEAFDKLNEYYFNNELPTVCLMLCDTSRRYSYGWFTTHKIWTDDRDDHKMHEIALSASMMRLGMHFMIGVLLHELIHLHCSERGIKDTSNGVTYHNSKFKEEAEKRGLIFSQLEVCKVNGWYQTSLSPEAEAIVDKFELDVNAFAVSRSFVDVVSDIEEDEEEEEDELAIKTVKRGRRKNSEYSCPLCDLKFKARDTMSIICGNCEVPLEEDYYF